MKFIFVFLMIIHFSFSLRINNNENENFVVKLQENFMRKIENNNAQKEFKNVLFRQLEDQHFYRPVSHKLKQNSTDFTSEHLSEEMRIYKGDYFSSKRHLRFYISREKECSILVNDTVHYTTNSHLNFIEHSILHNNGESINPLGVYSDQVNITFFAFNRKLNLFSVYFENPTNLKEFIIEYDFLAENIMKTTVEKSQYAERLSPNVLSHNNSFKYEGNDTIVHKHMNNFNWFIWKILNENFNKKDEFIQIETVFSMGNNFDHINVDFSFGNFTKSIEIENGQKMVKYYWEGNVKSSELRILECKFPLIFEKCSTIRLNFIMIMIGSVFIIFLIAMLHMILSNAFFEDF